MKHILSGLLLLGLALGLYASPVNSSTATDIARRWLLQSSIANKQTLTIGDVTRIGAPPETQIGIPPVTQIGTLPETRIGVIPVKTGIHYSIGNPGYKEPLTLENPSDPGLYLLKLHPKGFILISTDDRVKPILGFSFDSDFAENLEPETVRWFLASYTEKIGLITADTSLPPHPEWEQIRHNALPQANRDRDVIPLLVTTWKHSWPFNAMCPVESTLPSGHVNGGCMAGAVSQILKYWGFPTHGVGSNSYTQNPYGEISADFAATTYDYESMPNSLDNTPDDDISQLIYHAGVAMNMIYSSTGSSATPSNARDAIVEHFSYAESAIVRTFLESGEEEWINYLVSDLEMGRPIIQYGSDPVLTVGHGWIVDGLLEDDYFHINWGWGGTYNGFYYMNNLHPGQYWFNNSIGGIFDVHPYAFVPAPANFTATVQGFDDVNLHWDTVTQVAPTGYAIYRNGTLLTTLNEPGAQAYQDQNLAPGTYSYYIKTLCLYGTSEASSTVTVMVFSAPVVNYTTSFETFTDYAAIAFPWQSMDMDQAPTVTVSGYEYPNKGAAGSFFVIRPLYMIPPNWDITMHQGFKAAASFGAVNVPNNDWLITPVWNSGNNAQVRFWAKSDLGTHQASQLKVGFSTDPANPTQMTVLSGATPIIVPSTWTEYVFDISGHYSQNMVICFQNVSTNGYLLMIDDINLNTGVANEDNTDTQAPALSNLRVYPNPARGVANISYESKTDSPASVHIYDTKGRRIKTITDNSPSKGSRSITWDGTDEKDVSAPAGVYIIQVSTGGQTQASKVLLLQK